MGQLHFGDFAHFNIGGDNVTLRGLAEARPVTPEGMLRVSGVGPAKLERYGEAFLDVISEYVDGLQSRSEKAAGVANRPRLGGSHDQTLLLLQQGMSIAEIAEQRGLTQGTIMAHIERIKTAGREFDVSPLLPPPEKTRRIRAALTSSEDGRLAPVKEQLGDDCSYEEIRLVRLVCWDE